MKAGVAMIRVVLLALGATASAGAALFAQEASEPAPAMAAAANSFLSILDAPKRAKARVAFNSGERLNWNFVPGERQGVSIKQMSSEQRRAAFALLKSTCRPRGSRGRLDSPRCVRHLGQRDSAT
jgi:hypothetical protein